MQRAVLGAGTFCYVSILESVVSPPETELRGIPRLSRRTGLSAVFSNCRVAASKRAKPSAWDPPPGSLIRAYSERFLGLMLSYHSCWGRPYPSTIQTPKSIVSTDEKPENLVRD